MKLPSRIKLLLDGELSRCDNRRKFDSDVYPTARIFFVTLSCGRRQALLQPIPTTLAEATPQPPILKNDLLQALMEELATLARYDRRESFLITL